MSIRTIRVRIIQQTKHSAYNRMARSRDKAVC